MGDHQGSSPAGTISADLREELERSQRLGLIGPTPLDDHVEHARGYATAAGLVPTDAADLGSGGGLPALVLAEMWPHGKFTLIDARERVIAHLDVVVARLGWLDRVTTRLASAEAVGHDPATRGAFDLVTARGFGPPAMTAECGAPLLKVGGRLVVSEPPGHVERWPAEDLANLGLRHLPEASGRYVVMEAIAPCADHYPRRQGQPRNKPLW